MSIVKILSGQFNGKFGIIPYDGLIHVYRCKAIINPKLVEHEVVREFRLVSSNNHTDIQGG